MQLILWEKKVETFSLKTWIEVIKNVITDKLIHTIHNPVAFQKIIT